MRKAFHIASVLWLWVLLLPLRASAATVGKGGGSHVPKVQSPARFKIVDPGITLTISPEMVRELLLSFQDKVLPNPLALPPSVIGDAKAPVLPSKLEGMPSATRTASLAKDQSLTVKADDGTKGIENVKISGAVFDGAVPKTASLVDIPGLPQAPSLGQAGPRTHAAPKAKPTVLDRIVRAELPVSGPFTFEPSRHYRPGNPLPVVRSGREKGFIDKDGNVWIRGPYHGKPGPDAPAFEWDVQLSEAGMRSWGRFARKGKGYINVRPDGELSH